MVDHHPGDSGTSSLRGNMNSGDMYYMLEKYLTSILVIITP